MRHKFPFIGPDRVGPNMVDPRLSDAPGSQPAKVSPWRDPRWRSYAFQAVLMGVIGFTVLGGLGLIACGRAFAAEKNWGRAPVVLANLIVLGVVKYQFEGNFLIGASPLLALSIPILYLAITIIPNS